MTSKLARQIRKDREAMKMSQGRLAGFAGLNRRTIWRAETGEPINSETEKKLRRGFAKANREPQSPSLNPAELRPRRIRAGLTQLELAAKSGIANTTISQAETGEQVPHQETLAALFAAIDNANESRIAGESYRERRVGAGLSQAELAKLAGVTVPAIRRTERDRGLAHGRDRAAVRKIDGALNVATTLTPAEAIRERRRQLRTTREELAGLARLSEGTIRRVEAGEDAFPATLKAIHDALDKVARERDEGRPIPSGAKLRELRIKAGMSQAELARRVGVQQRNLSKAELGQTRPRVKLVRAIESALEEHREGAGGAAKARLYPKAVGAGKQRQRRAEESRMNSKPNRWRSAATKAACKFCYLEYRLKERKRPQVFLEAKKMESGPQDESNVTNYANRFADREELPRKPEPEEVKKLLKTLGVTQGVTHDSNAL